MCVYVSMEDILKRRARNLKYNKSKKGKVVCLKAVKKHYQKNKDNQEFKEKRRLIYKKWYETNKESIWIKNNESSKKYFQTKKGKQARRNSKAIRRMAEKKGKVTLKEWENLLIVSGHSCAICKIGENLEQDHIIPLSKGGKHEIKNIQPLCRSCNARKSNKL